MRTLSFLGLDAAERPRLNATSIRQLAKLGTVVRWPGLLFAAVLSLAVPPKLPRSRGPTTPRSCEWAGR